MLYTIKTDPERAAQPALDAYVESLDWRATLCEIIYLFSLYYYYFCVKKLLKNYDVESAIKVMNTRKIIA